MSETDTRTTEETERARRPGRERGRDDGKFGRYGGQYVPEALMPAIEELTDAYERYVLNNEDGFMDEFRERLADFGGRPTPLQRAGRLSERYDTEVYLKREDLLHGGAHKLNNALGQVLLAKYMGKERIIAETGAGQHGTATAMAAAHLDMPCTIYMGERDINRQRPNVFRMKLNGSEVKPVTTGRGTLKEAISETMRDWAATVEDTHYVIGSIVGPHPFPVMVRDFQAVISEEAREQAIEKTGGLPTDVVACAGGGSNTMGTFAEFVDDESVALRAVEAGGSTLEVDEEAGVAPNSASLYAGEEGVLHGARTKLLQDSDGQIMESHSVSSGLDYAGVGPELAYLVDEGRVEPVAVDDDAALEGFHRLSNTEGIIPALETAHAFGYLEEHHEDLGDRVVVNVSGRGDKDLDAAIEETDRRDVPNAPDMSMFTGGI
ncbi:MULTISPECIES: tryptophan synthase subunit beta [Halorubrum]|uniref:Tryptophan synthase beta chain n=1 Tax=Halorubrum sodomense TaxID=35743 RepID=A0A1I6H3B7_HALSD|nr:MULTISPECIES: tryptophan synthase subunit beta [Halorubrum]TKX54933.1 tryptophan synthase subunit beta [Halorubrum sp. SP3]TKX71567.1 tryptophan synthase subunit beta [Halorubrum sp. SP9]SFR48910.1 tryptophan synthase beta chain [Halorubrum sodomense]